MKYYKIIWLPVLGIFVLTGAVFLVFLVFRSEKNSFSTVTQSVPITTARGQASQSESSSELANPMIPGREASTERLHEALQILDPEARRKSLKQLGAAFGKMDPHAGWKQLTTVTGLEDRQVFAGALVEAWAQRSTPEALGACSTLPPGELQATCTAMAIGVWAGSSPKEAIEWASGSLHGSIRQMAVTEAAGQWARQDPLAAAQWAADRQASAAAGSAVAEVMGYWAETDPRSAVDWAAQLPEGSFKKEALTSLILNWADQFPGEAAAWAVTQSNRPELLEIAGAAWAKSDPVGAASWASTLSDPKVKSEILSSTLASWGAASPQSALDWISRSKNADADTLRETVLGQWAGEDPIAAVGWARSNGFTESGQGVIFRQWASSSPETLASWVDAQPIQNRPDAALDSLALRLADQSPTSALERAASIQDLRRRSRTQTRILAYWEDHDPQAAAEWLAKHPDRK